MFFIPIVIILVIVGLMFAGPALKDLNLSLPNLSLFSSGTSTSEKAQPTQKPAVSQKSYLASPTRAPPAPSPARTKNFGKIKISSVQATNDSSPARITLTPNFTTETQINITGWKLQSTWSGGFTFPLGVSIPHPNFTTTATEQIIVKKNDAVYVRGDASPFGQGISFRTNECLGYLNQYYKNMPESFSCPSNPKPSINDVKNLTPLCQDYILNKIDYGSCTAPDYSNQIAVSTNYNCVTYVNALTQNFTYEGCVSKHSADANFFSNKWYVYINEALGNPLHDSITLSDQQGNIVDTYTY